jgi:hypothetical protein
VILTVCYIFPLIAAALVHSQRKIGKRNDEPGLWLSHLLYGGAIFGLVDHWWNGQLLFVGPNPAGDLLLGGAITLAIYSIWYAMVATSQLKAAARAGVPPQ